MMNGVVGVIEEEMNIISSFGVSGTRMMAEIVSGGVEGFGVSGTRMVAEIVSGFCVSGMDSKVISEVFMFGRGKIWKE